MAEPIENSPWSVHMDDIGFERLSRPFSLGSAEPYDPSYTPIRVSSSRIAETEPDVDKHLSEPDRFFLLHKHGLLHKLRRGHGAVGQGHIHWLCPTVMAISLLAGLLLAVGHHVYYRWLDGQPVGSIVRQQWSLRIGNFFAIGVSFLLKIAVGIAYTQILWRTLRINSISLGTINDAFNIGNNIFSFLNWELLSRVRIGVILAVVLWSIPLTSLVAPATLSVTRSLLSSSADAEVFNIGISNSSLRPEFIYKSKGDIPGIGASSRLARIVGAVAMAGQRQDFQAPTSQANISYDLQAYVPLLRCSSANATVRSQIITLLMNVKDSIYPFWDPLIPEDFNNQTFHWSINMSDGENQAHGDIGYFGAVPVAQYAESWSQNYTILPWWNSSQTAVTELYSLHGEILIAILKDTAGHSNETLMEFINCQLYNSSLTFNVAFTDHVSNTTIIENKWMNDLYANDDTENLDSYFAFFKEISTYLIGSVSWFIDTLGSATYEPSANLLDTHLATSSQVYYMNQKIMEEADVQNQTYRPDQVRNISFAQDIEDLALKSSLSLLSDSTLCNTVIANVTATTTETVYLYEATNLILIYSFVLATSIAAVLFGTFALYSNGVGYDTNVSTFAITMQNPDIREVLKHHSTSMQPLDKSLSKLRLRFAGPEGFVPGNSIRNYPK